MLTDVLPLAGLPGLATQIIWLATLSLATASVAWTVTHEEIFREPREFCVKRSQTCRTLLERKFFYIFTCEYCFSHYVTIFFLWLTHFRLLVDGWRGYIVAFFAMTAATNIYLSLYGRLRVDIKVDRLEAVVKEQHVAAITAENKRLEPESGTRPE
jgi:hypothetical protein